MRHGLFFETGLQPILRQWWLSRSVRIPSGSKAEDTFQLYSQQWVRPEGCEMTQKDNSGNMAGMESSKKLYRVGIVGFGFMGRANIYNHINLPLHYGPLPFQTQVTHICTAHPDSARKGCDEFGIQHGVTDYREITENPEIDVVQICSPNAAHFEQLSSAIRAGKHIYCDKPLVTDTEQADRLRQLLSDYTGMFGMTFQNRFFPAVLRAKQLINAGFLGRVLSFRAAFLHSGSVDPEAPLKWKLSANEGGGVIADLGSHVLDMVSWLVGDIVAVAAASQIAYSSRPTLEGKGRQAVDAEDACLFMARVSPHEFPDELALGTVEATKIATGAEDELRIEIHGTEGAIKFNSTRPGQLAVFKQNESDQPIGGFRGWTHIDTGQRYPGPATGFPGPKFSLGWMRSHLASLADFIFCVHHKRPFQPDAAQGIYIQHVMDCLRKSIRSEKWIGVPQRR